MACSLPLGGFLKKKFISYLSALFVTATWKTLHATTCEQCTVAIEILQCGVVDSYLIGPHIETLYSYCCVVHSRKGTICCSQVKGPQ